ncbi:thioester reductase [Lasius niger]|uniref:Thioester reductase n=1 Tax=Lasius niger TaxID=67767 RepID=A0A0J7JY91_LASNI|nr:thioester reductase [Lasius niger]
MPRVVIKSIQPLTSEEGEIVARGKTRPTPLHVIATKRRQTGAQSPSPSVSRPITEKVTTSSTSHFITGASRPVNGTSHRDTGASRPVTGINHRDTGANRPVTSTSHRDTGAQWARRPGKVVKSRLQR